MSIVNYIFLGCSVISVLLGLCLVGDVFSNLRRRRKKRMSRALVHFKIFGVEFRGQQSFARTAIGVFLVLFPIMALVYLQPRDASPQPRASIVPVPLSFIETSDAAEPTLDGFRVLRDVRVIDLRARVPVPASQRLTTKLSPTNWTRYTLLRKLSDARKHVVFEFATTGFDISLRSLTHDAIPEKVTVPHLHGNVMLKHTWRLPIDVQRVRINQDFLVINEATYWNAFAGDDKEWAAMPVTDNTDYVAMLVIFPEDKPFKSFDLYEKPRFSKELKRFPSPWTTFNGANHQTLLWQIDKPTKGYEYQVNWTW